MKENYTPMTMKDTDYRKMVEPYYQEAKQVLRDYIACPSVFDAATKSEEHPFGEGVEKALSFVATLGKKLGFKVDRCDNYITELSYGEGEKTFDIYAHSDVVPVAKKNWHYDPFKLTAEDGVFYGRGTNDDKGPGLACLYAVKALMDNNRLGGYKLRFLFGGNEENDSLGLKHYFEVLKKGYPTYGISPDADYPLIYAEKSIYAYEADYPVKMDNVESFTWGDALNIVLEDATITFKDISGIEEKLHSFLEESPKIKAHMEGNRAIFKGVSSHGSLPWNGVNAGLYALKFLGELYGIDILKDIFSHYNDGRGEGFEGNYKDQVFCDSSYNVGKFSFDKTTLKLFVNFRFPSSLKVTDLIPDIAKKTKAKITLLGGSDGFVSDPNSDFIRILMNAYQEETGDKESKPLAIGGGTYARESKNSVAFGAAFIGREMRMHGNDEFFPESDFYDNMQIYAHAIDLISVYLRTGKKPF